MKAWKYKALSGLLKSVNNYIFLLTTLYSVNIPRNTSLIDLKS